MTPDRPPGAAKTIRLGTTADGRTAWTTPSDLVGHAAYIGSSGGGKTVEADVLASQLARHGPIEPDPRIFVDPKGDLKDFAVWLAALSTALPQARADALIRASRVCAPFRRPEPMNLLARTSDEPEVQALEICEALAVGLDGDAAFAQIWPALTTALAVAIAAGNLTLIDVPRLLANPTWLRAVLEGLPNGHLKLTAYDRLSKLQSRTLQAILVRLDRFLSTSALRALWQGPGCWDWAERLDHGDTIVDLSDPPGGRAVAALVGGVLLARLVRAVLARRVIPQTTRPLTILLDELPEILTSRTGEALGRALALSRHRLASWWLLAQDMSQIAKRSPELPALIQANVRHVFAFSGTSDSVKWLSAYVPTPAERSRTHGWTPPRSSVAAQHDAERHAQQLLTALPRRVFFYVDRAVGGKGQLLASPTVDLADIERRAAGAPAHVRRHLALDPEPSSAIPAALSPPVQEQPPRVPERMDPVAMPSSPPAPDPAPSCAPSHSARPIPVEDEPPTTGPGTTDRRTPSWPAAFPSLGWTPWSPPPTGAAS